MATAKENKDDISTFFGDMSKDEVFHSVFLRLPKFYKLSDVGDFIDALKPFVGIDEILGLGKVGGSGQWQLTLKTAEAMAKLLEKRFIYVNNRKCVIYPYENRQVIGRIHWLPIEVPDDEIKNILKNFGSVVHFSKENIDAEGDAPSSLVRFFILNLAADANVEEIPHFIMVKEHQGLVTVRDRDPMCLCCSQIGHRKSECPNKPSRLQKQVKPKKKHVLESEANETRASNNSASDKCPFNNCAVSEEVLKRRGYEKTEPPGACALCSSTSTSVNKESISKGNQTLDSPCSSLSDVKQNEQIAQTNLQRALPAKQGVNEMLDEVKNLKDLMNVFSQKINEVLTDIVSISHSDGNKSDTKPIDLEDAASASMANVDSSNKSGKKKKKKKSKSNSNYDLAAAEPVGNEASGSGQCSSKDPLDSGVAICGHSSSVNTSVNANEIQNLSSKVESVSVNCFEASNINTSHTASSHQKKKKKNKKKVDHQFQD